MNVLLVSQCSKRALSQSRRILDQFAERRGERTWFTAITLAGLDTLRKMLKQTARKNTAVACHRIGGPDSSELLWIVGDAKQFNSLGTVPTNQTACDVLKTKDENDWHSLEILRLIAGMAGLFHDFGKASQLFQNKLSSNARIADPYRHEWVSLRLFQAYVGIDADAIWLARLLSDASSTPNLQWLRRLEQDGVTKCCEKPFAKMAPLARAVAWLVLSHHRLPFTEQASSAVFDDIYVHLDAAWTQQRSNPSPDSLAECWNFPKGVPSVSQKWRRKAAELAKRLLKIPKKMAERAWGLDPFTMQLGRMALMLGDHYYSSQPPMHQYGDGKALYPIFANTDKLGQLKQLLDEHLIGVALHTAKIVNALPKLSDELPRIARAKKFAARSSDARFAWQNKAFELAQGLCERSAKQGFFGVNMASTGGGKTLANARIMYGLSTPELGARFSIALGLRTLTLQTGTALRERMGLGEDDMAVLVGSAAVRALYAQQQKEKTEHSASNLARGSESAEDLLSADSHVFYEGALSCKSLSEWLSGARGNVNKMLQAPVLVCTIDHLIHACESTRGGHQIAPMLRLLTSDLVLDEPDDFDLSDLPALSRLVYMTGLLGSRVLLSSATLAPALVQGLFEAYRAGRAEYQKHRGHEGARVDICCAWFDEFGCTSSHAAQEAQFAGQHQAFIARRLKQLAKLEVRRRARIVDVEAPDCAKLKDKNDPAGRSAVAVTAMAREIFRSAKLLHQRHHVVAPNSSQRVSIGLVRMANIDPLIDVAKTLLEKAKLPETMRIHLCVYHSRFPLLMRSSIERTLDRVLARQPTGENGDADAIFSQPDIQALLTKHSEPDQIFIVLASPVAEVGRDHDYDWAIVEPSSMRSIIQLAGRVRRHRLGAVKTENIVLLDRNMKGIKGQRPRFTKPGFESEESNGYALNSACIKKLLRPEQFQSITAAPRIHAAALLDVGNSLVDLEHSRLQSLMLDNANTKQTNIRPFWATGAWLTGYVQTKTRFRLSAPSDSYFLAPDEDNASYKFMRVEENGDLSEQGLTIESLPAHKDGRITLWPLQNFHAELARLAEKREAAIENCARTFATLELEELDGGKAWLDCGLLGFRRGR